jgi:alpha-ketoglutarate-dependent taurine dioxygenase
MEAFNDFMRIVSRSLMEYKERSTPRTRVGSDIYTSTEYPPHLDIVQHNENSYASTWPRTIAFYCEVPADTGGETPLADSGEVYRRVPGRVREAFASTGVMYVRNYGLGVDLSWQDAYQTSDRAAVEAYCRGASISCEWLDGGQRLRTRQVRPAVARHPLTREWLWFNQAHLFHTSGLDRATREALHATFAEADLPRQAFFGDGSPIPVAWLDDVRDAYRESLQVFSWQRGDVLLVDNMRISHGRRAFTGPRKVYVAMAEPWSATE